MFMHILKYLKCKLFNKHDYHIYAYSHGDRHNYEWFECARCGELYMKSEIKE